MIKIKTKKLVSTCKTCNKEVYSDYLLSDYPCPYCEGEVDFIKLNSVKEVTMIISHNDLRINLSLILNNLEVYLKKDQISDQHLFTIKNPQIRKGFPKARLPEEYNELQGEMKEWVLDNYAEVFKVLV